MSGGDLLTDDLNKNGFFSKVPISIIHRGVVLVACAFGTIRRGTRDASGELEWENGDEDKCGFENGKGAERW